MEHHTEHDLGTLEDVFEDYLNGFGMKVATDVQRRLIRKVFDAQAVFDPVCALYCKGTIVIVPRQTIDEVKTLAFLDAYQNQINYLSL